MVTYLVYKKKKVLGLQELKKQEIENKGSMFCMLYRAINGDSGSSAVERREDPGPVPHPPPSHHRYEGPPTPCPARVEYATPVFARNYQGVWRYVVQIPYEGYFTQTIEVTRCMQSRCHYLDGGCLSSPRWVSLLVAELHYPHVLLSPDTAATPAPGSAQGPATPTLDDFQDYQQYLQKRAGSAPAGVAGGSDGSGGAAAGSGERPHCDGHDHLGCFQVSIRALGNIPKLRDPFMGGSSKYHAWRQDGEGERALRLRHDYKFYL
ncbi:hypothetical protein EVAR_43167_1 [Eumeta japonica]|uniref:Spaetzle domain-containing protein n=1 Tax=Eumeta variegata TaxID=151549 RepID=A0A4C1XMN1_EUMVA|nr:hypothetical protein EVAR_43167_1 [Eumeta japonica]